jgi:peptidyl-dipeptidase Dcp
LIIILFNNKFEVKMQKIIFLLTPLFLFACVFFFSQCATEKQNPFFHPYNTKYDVPPFDKIKNEHYLPAFLKGIEETRKEVDTIANSTDKPTFKNTILALEHSGALLDKVGAVFNNLFETDVNEAMQDIAKEITPQLSKLQDDILLNEKLFARVKEIYEENKDANIPKEDWKLIEKIYKRFVRGGINLPEDKKDRFRQINEELSLLYLKYEENILKETNDFKLVIETEEDLDGLPQRVIDDANETAKTMELDGKWVFTIDKPSLIPFLQYSTKRNLREQIYKAYYNRANNNNEFDNKKILSKIASLRVERASLLGYKDHASFILEERMAKNSESVYKLLNQVWKVALPIAKKDMTDMQKIINQEGGNFKLASWDWWYYSEKLRKEKYDLDENELRPYFKLENVVSGVFTLANKLYGINFEERHDIPKYHPDVKTFVVTEADGSLIGIFLTDYFPRASKRAGAWMNEFRSYKLKDGKVIEPIILNVGNLTKPTADAPSLLSLDDVNTLFHEFGHALHYLFAKVPYETVQHVPSDFVELPSQIMEHWAFEPEVLQFYAKHYQTGEIIPEHLVKKIENSSHFNQGFMTVEFLAAAFLDMDWHTLTDSKEQDATKFEEASMNKIGLISEIIPRYKSPYFRHVFSGGYSAGYYSYIWAEVLDCDAYESFKEHGIFNQELAKSFRTNLLEKGGIEEGMDMYIKFKGAEPKIDALLKNRGLK